MKDGAFKDRPFFFCICESGLFSELSAGFLRDGSFLNEVNSTLPPDFISIFL
jgi:hypothetical protein